MVQSFFFWAFSYYYGMWIFFFTISNEIKIDPNFLKQQQQQQQKGTHYFKEENIRMNND